MPGDVKRKEKAPRKSRQHTNKPKETRNLARLVENLCELHHWQGTLLATLAQQVGKLSTLSKSESK